MVTKSTQTQYGRKCDGQFHKKRSKKCKKQKGYTTERFMPGNAVIMLIFQIKRINLSPKKINLVVSFSCSLKVPKNWVCPTTLNEEKKGGWPFNIGIKLFQSISIQGQDRAYTE